MKSITESLAQDLGSRLLNMGLTVTTAESCTGGGVASAITNIPGSSTWFEMGFVTYSNQAKVKLLGVSPETLEQHGAVSEAVVREMAIGALQQSGANVAAAVSGIAGPTGGSEEKPVGTVWLAWACDFKPEVVVLGHHFNGGRSEVRNQAVMAALRGISEMIK
ncbi:CinA family protein [Halioxenophilus aromaticivorans]|uniref:Nicotinamide-nucleotide amidase n=1 Tax=Halioxenophilus aromaticivorans TaxID=1306992 RepID=A0AAV3TY78_9ALTE